ncbi:MAG TPA: DUF5652 family protein [Patescibacteria group bacterium]|nr:DUF5652 family protein [Patescibacteria group bacterium]
MHPLIFPYLLRTPFFFVLLLILVVDMVLRGYALWHAARNNQQGWFIAMMLVNSVGILPAIYLLFFLPKKGKGKK